MDSLTYFKVNVPKNISVAALTYQIFNEKLAQSIVNKAMLLYNALKCRLECSFRYF